MMAAPHPLGRVALRGVPCAGAMRSLGDVDRGFRLGMMTLDRLRPTVGAAACGMAARALDEAIARAATRRQFGQPIGDLQLVREKLGRMATELQAARLLVYSAAWLADRGADRITVEAAMAKSYATEAAQRIVDDAVQIMGGAGVLRRQSGRAPLPGRARVAHLRRRDRGAASHHRRVAAEGGQREA